MLPGRADERIRFNAFHMAKFSCSRAAAGSKFNRLRGELLCRLKRQRREFVSRHQQRILFDTTEEVTKRQQKATDPGGCQKSDIAQAVGYPTQALCIGRSCAASRRAELFCMKVMVGLPPISCQSELVGEAVVETRIATYLRPAFRMQTYYQGFSHLGSPAGERTGVNDNNPHLGSRQFYNC